MNILTVIRRAFAVNPRTVPLGQREAAVLAARGIQQPAIRSYFAWRRSLMVFVVLATVLSAGLSTWRGLTESENRLDLLETIADRFPLEESLLLTAPDAMGTDEDDADADDANADEMDPPDGEEADPSASLSENADAEEEEQEPQTTFGQFTEIVQLIALFALPIAALAAALFWTRLSLSFWIMVWAFAFSFLVPLLIALCPWSWWGYEDPVVTPQTPPLQRLEWMAEGVLEGTAYLVTLLPTVLSLVPGVQRACIRVKLLLPQSMLPGWFLVVASPFYAMFLLVVFVAINQIDTHPLFFAGMLLFLCAPLVYAVRADLFTRPLSGEGDDRRIRRVQRIVAAMTGLAVATLTTYLATREAMGVRLLGLDPKTSLLLPLDIVEFVLEVLGRSMFITALGADLFMRMNLNAWKNSNSFAGTPEAGQYDRIMGELERVAGRSCRLG